MSEFSALDILSRKLIEHDAMNNLAFQSVPLWPLKNVAKMNMWDNTIFAKV